MVTALPAEMIDPGPLLLQLLAGYHSVVQDPQPRRHEVGDDHLDIFISPESTTLHFSSKKAEL